MHIDIRRAYNTALEWKVTGDIRYTDQTARFLNAWSYTNTAVTGTAD